MGKERSNHAGWRGRIRRWRGWEKRMDGCREECVEWGRGDVGHYSRPSIQLHRVVSVPFPAALTDAVVDGDIHQRIELQSEDVERGERVTFLAPLAAPCSTAVHGTPQQRHHKKEGEGGHETHSGGVRRAGEQMGVCMQEEFRGAPYEVWLRVLFC